MLNLGFPKRPSRPEAGFTLVELMIVVAILGILAAIAYPNYVNQVKRSKRSDAQTVLMEASQYMQRYYIAKNSFADMTTEVLTDAGYGQSPKSGGAEYTIEVELNNSNRGYLLTATPLQTDEACGYLTLSDAGVKGQEVDGATGLCWK